ncbi:hypothetical protein Vadar_009747 [Vaccinium darrowii]|uniref:Uncharacterized protein n=1 Tax=Vaccinium darrowii TaxID=229202 RepID=A0ACB7XGD4_9ERIC|nr:hypothetical protein Vadar_009747 [Vaccinium darrowii]
MSHDQSRVSSLQKRLRVKSDANFFESLKATVPVNSGHSIGTGNYVVTLGFGTSKKDLTLIIDTGSDVTWIQCEPCRRRICHLVHAYKSIGKGFSFSYFSILRCVYYFKCPKLLVMYKKFLFRQQMMNYTMTQGVSLFDTCYNFRGHDTVVVPDITFVFAGNVEVRLDFSGILVATSQTQACLAFVGNSDASEVGIFGNLQQQTLDVVYDVAGGKIGFGTGGCSIPETPNSLEWSRLTPMTENNNQLVLQCWI